jgi:MFS family permease
MAGVGACPGVAVAQSPPEALSARAAAQQRGLTLQTFAAFRSVPFRLLWTNTFTFALIQSTQRFTFVWLVLDLGRGSGAIGAVSFALGIPVFFFAIPAGVLADRVDRRLLLMSSQLGAVAISALTAVFIVTGAINLWITLGLSAAMGATVAAGMPARQAIIPSIVDRDRLMNAIVLMSMGQNVSQIVGPVVGGVVIAFWGLSGAFFTQAALLGLGALMILPLRVPRPPGTTRNVRKELKEGFRFIAFTPSIRLLVLMLAVAGVFMIGPFTALLPQIAREQLGQSAFAASMLFAFMGLGMMVTSLGLASVQDIPHKGGWFLGSLAMGGVMLALIGLSPWYAATCVLMFVGGMGGGVYMNLNQTLIQGHTPHEVMGRVMSVHTLCQMGIGPMGSLLAGALASLMGAPLWMAISGAILAFIALSTLVTQPALRRMT